MGTPLPLDASSRKVGGREDPPLSITERAVPAPLGPLCPYPTSHLGLIIGALWVASQQIRLCHLKESLGFLVRTDAEASGGFEAAPPGVRPHVAGV